MKLNADKIKEAAAWVEKNGLFPQACGASVKEFCKAMGIGERTYTNWCKIAAFADAISRARELFKSQTIREVENALVKAAKGVDFTKEKTEAKAEKVVEYDPKTGKKVREYMGEPKVVKATRETFYYPPDVKAAQFVLTNMAPEAWKNKQETEHKGLPENILIVKNEEEARKLRNIGKVEG